MMNCNIGKFQFDLLLLIDCRLGNQKTKLVRSVFKERTTSFGFKANESVLQIEVNVSAWLYSIYFEFSLQNGGTKGNRTL